MRVDKCGIEKVFWLCKTSFCCCIKNCQRTWSAYTFI